MEISGRDPGGGGGKLGFFLIKFRTLELISRKEEVKSLDEILEEDVGRVGFFQLFLNLALISRSEEVEVIGQDPGGRCGKGGLLHHHILDLGINI